jgi:hypothetical protein
MTIPVLESESIAYQLVNLFFCLTMPIIEARPAAKAIESAMPIQAFTARILGKNAIAQRSRQAQSKRRLLADAIISLPPGKILVLPAGF